MLYYINKFFDFVEEAEYVKDKHRKGMGDSNAYYSCPCNSLADCLG